MSEIRCRIDQLANHVNQALLVGNYGGQQSGRVREALDRRTIRYYTTLGILDRPLEMSGRTALYGRRHLLQLVCIKRLQAQGMSLVDIQRSLSGADEKTLMHWADLPSGFIDSLQHDKSTKDQPLSAEALLGSSTTSESIAGRSRFWESPPNISASNIEPTKLSVRATTVQTAALLPLTESAFVLLPNISANDVSEQQLTILQPAINQLISALRNASLV